ncbi:MAG: AMP-binding protein [Deltaproteobacteria bacterium]|nr:AMP-binding protein [Deltaproteobacteria bacterium]
MNLAQVLMEENPVAQEKTAIRFTDQKTTYKEVRQQVERSAAALHQLGIARGDRVALLLPKGLEFIELNLAALALGAATLPLNPAYRPEEIAYFLSDSESSLLVTYREKYDELKKVSTGFPDLPVLLIDGDRPSCIAYSRLLLQVRRFKELPFPGAEDDLALLCYTSGTTGRSKGAMITHGNLVHNLQALRQAWQWSDRDILLHALPLFHIHGLMVALYGSLLAGATLIMLERFEPRTVWETLDRESCTIFMGVPTMYQRLTQARATLSEKPRLRAMRLFVSGSAPLSEPLFHLFREQTGHTILERYGMTEAGMIASNPYPPERRKAKSVGYPLCGVQLRIVDSKGAVVSPGEVGEVRIRGNNIFKGYWRQPEKTAEAFQGGWFKSGDLGRQDPGDEDRLYLVGRAKELIISGGLNVYPKEVENVLETHEAVLEAAVYGGPDEDLGEKVLAAVVLKEGTPISTDEIVTYCRQHLAPYKCPKKITLLPALPRNAMGKIQKQALTEV